MAWGTTPRAWRALSAAGELSELFGAVAIGADRNARLHRFRHRARLAFELATAEDREIIEAYTHGVNSGLAALGGAPFEYLLLRQEPARWQDEDGFLVLYAMFLQLQDPNGRAESNLGVMRDILPAEALDFLAPLGTMALGVFLLGERLTPLKQVSIVFALGAVIVLTFSYGQMPWVALLLAGSWSWYGLTKRRVPLDPIASLSSELFVLVIPASILVVGGFVRNGGIPDEASGVDWPLLVGTGAITAIPLLLFAFAAKRVPFTILGPANYLVPIINFLLGWLVFDELLTPSRMIGFALVWVALMLVTVDMVRQRPARPSIPAVPGR